MLSRFHFFNFCPFLGHGAFCEFLSAVIEGRIFKVLFVPSHIFFRLLSLGLDNKVSCPIYGRAWKRWSHFHLRVLTVRPRGRSSLITESPSVVAPGASLGKLFLV